MKTPRKLYLVTSRRARLDGEYATRTLWMKRGKAQQIAEERNYNAALGVTDWRVVSFDVDSTPRSS